MEKGKRYCDARLVPAAGEISDDSRVLFDFETPEVGCGNVVCLECETRVASEPAGQPERGRRYRCRCSERVVTKVDHPERDEDSRHGVVPPWRCGGHAPASLPMTVDGVEIAADVDVTWLFEQAVRVSAKPEWWISRIWQIGHDTPLPDRLALGGLDALTHPDVRVRALAVTEAAGYGCRFRAREARGRRIVAALRDHRELFAGSAMYYSRSTDPLPPGLTLEDQLVSSLAQDDDADGPEVTDFLRTYLLEPGRPARLAFGGFMGQLRRDREWTLDHLGAIVDATPEVAPVVYHAIVQLTDAEALFARVDLRVLRRGALEMRHWRTKQVQAWLREHDAEWAAVHLLR
jgi:hypothetical protein